MPSHYHAIAILSGNRQKTLPNKTEEQMLSQVVLPFVANGVVTANWGNKLQTYQVLELRIYGTTDKWNKKEGSLSELIARKKNQWGKFKEKADKLLGSNKYRIFIVTPIQGSEHGTQEDQRVFAEFDARFETMERVLSDFQGVAIRIDREHPLEDVVSRIKREIREADFIVADITDERPSCYFEAGFAEALGKPVIYVASQQSVIHPGVATKVHFDVHMNVHFFTNKVELGEKLRAAVEKNKARLFGDRNSADQATVTDA